MKLNFNIKLHKAQAEIFNDPSRFKVVVAGRRFGKTVTALSLILKYAFSKPNQLVWYIAPSYGAAKRVIWRDLKEIIPKKFVKAKNETDLTILLKNNSEISLKGAENADMLRGSGLNFVVLDEFQDFKEGIWEKVVRPSLTDKLGHALIIGTPKYLTTFYDLYLRGKDPKHQKRGWKSWQFTSYDNPLIPREEILQAKADLDEKSFNQEYYAMFQNISGMVYYPFKRTVHASKERLFNPELPIWIGQDFNLDPMCSAILQPQMNGDLWMIGEIILKNSSTVELAEELERRFYRYKVKNQIEIYPDPAGNQRAHTRGESDFDILRQMGFRNIFYRKKHPKISDRVNATNRMLMSANGKVRFFIDERCKEAISSFEKLPYKEGTREIDKSLGIEHITDAIGYPIQLRYPIRELKYYGVSK